MSSIIHCQNMLFLVGLKFNNLTGSVNTPLCRASVLPCVGTGARARSVLSRGLGEMGGVSVGGEERSKPRLSPESPPSAGQSPA